MTVEDLQKLKEKLTREFNQNLASIDQTIALMTHSSQTTTITTHSEAIDTKKIVTTTTLPRSIEAPHAQKNQSQIIREAVESCAGQFTVDTIKKITEKMSGRKVRVKAVMDWIYLQKGRTIEVITPGVGRNPAVYQRKNVKREIWKVLAGLNGLGESEPQIAAKTGLDLQTVCSELHKHRDVFSQGSDFLWRRSQK